MTTKKNTNLIHNEDIFIETIQNEDFKLTLVDDSSDNGSLADDTEYLSDEESNNKYTFLQKPKKKMNNQYKFQFKITKHKSKELVEEQYLSE